MFTCEMFSFQSHLHATQCHKSKKNPKYLKLRNYKLKCAYYCNCKHVYNGTLSVIKAHRSKLMGHIPEQAIKKKVWQKNLDMFLIWMLFLYNFTVIQQNTQVDIPKCWCLNYRFKISQARKVIYKPGLHTKKS